jgi:hypothetical protein
MKCLKFLIARKYSLVQKYEWNVPVSWLFLAVVAYYFNWYYWVVFAIPFLALAILVRLLLYTTQNWCLDIFLPHQFQGFSGVMTVTLFCCICLLYSCTPKCNLLCFSFTFSFLRDLSQLACFSSNLYACLSIHCSVHCNSFISTKFYHICCSAMWWDFSCVKPVIIIRLSGHSK